MAVCNCNAITPHSYYVTPIITTNIGKRTLVQYDIFMKCECGAKFKLATHVKPRELPFSLFEEHHLETQAYYTKLEI